MDINFWTFVCGDEVVNFEEMEGNIKLRIRKHSIKVTDFSLIGKIIW